MLINYLRKRACQKLNALARIAPLMNVIKLHEQIIMKPFIETQFSQCPLIWMFYSKELKNKISRFHERALRITYNDKLSS